MYPGAPIIMKKPVFPCQEGPRKVFIEVHLAHAAFSGVIQYIKTVTYVLETRLPDTFPE